MLHKKGLGVLLLVHYRKKDSVLVFKSSHLIGQADQPQDSFCCHHHRKAYTVPNEIDLKCVAERPRKAYLRCTGFPISRNLHLCPWRAKFGMRHKPRGEKALCAGMPDTLLEKQSKFPRYNINVEENMIP